MAHAQQTAAAAPRRSGPRVRAPDFNGAQRWLNTDHRISIGELRGQVVLLDFWTYCCINCMHVMPDLKYLEEKYRHEPLVVIGVHSGKFSQEKDPEHIRNAVLRHNLTHPIAVDSASTIWNAYAVQTWPTFVLIDAEGYIAGTLAGEGHREQLDRAIADLLAAGHVNGTLGRPLRFKPERDAFQSSVLEFPGKVVADVGAAADGGARTGGDGGSAAAKAEGPKGAGEDRTDPAPDPARLFISDTNHNRILVTDLAGHVQTVVGSGQAGLRDGAFAEAQFRQPQGLALSADRRILYVADTENHALRAVYLERGSVQTLAGNGRQAAVVSREAIAGRRAELSSPWDLARIGDRLFIAMAGTHQIWVYDVKAKTVRVFAGTGREGAVDGPSEQAGFAQPSGLASDGHRLYVADAEVSSIRVLDAKARGGRTETLAGSGELFDFGDQDGPGREARFQHPLGVALHSDELYVADTFNHVIRRIDPKSGVVTTWAGTGHAEPGSGKAIGFYEPGGLSVGGDTVYVADTNNHRIVAIEIPNKAVRVLDIAQAGARDARGSPEKSTVPEGAQRPGG